MSSRVSWLASLWLVALGLLTSVLLPAVSSTTVTSTLASIAVAPADAAGIDYGYDFASPSTTRSVDAHAVAFRGYDSARELLRPHERGSGAVLAARGGTDLVKYDAAAVLGRLAGGNPAKASELERFGQSQGWARSQTATGPTKYIDENGVVRLTIKSGRAPTPGSNFPHVEIRNAAGQRVGPYGNLVTRKGPGNHTPIDWDLP